MKTLNVLEKNKQTMMLKEITDLLNVRHSNAMVTVKLMLKDQEFGTSAEIQHSYNIPNGGFKTIKTYQLNKRQSIAVAARLNTALLMRIIDRWQELENALVPIVPVIKTPLELLNDAVEVANQLHHEKEVLEKQLAQIGNHLAGSTISELGEDMMFNVVAKLLSTNLEINLGQNTLMAILRSKGWLMIGRSHHEKNMPMQSKIDLMRVYLYRSHDSGKLVATTVLRPKGLQKLSTKIVKWYSDYLQVKEYERLLNIKINWN